MKSPSPDQAQRRQFRQERNDLDHRLNALQSYYAREAKTKITSAEAGGITRKELGKALRNVAREFDTARSAIARRLEILRGRLAS